MSVEPKVPSGDDSNIPSGDENKPDTVKHETYKRTVGQLKSAQTENADLKTRVAEYEAKEKSAEEKKLTEDGEFKTLLENERKKSADFEAKFNDREKDLMDAHKLNAFREKLPGTLKNTKYYSFVDVDKIIIDPTTGAIDDTSVETVVNGFVTDHGALIDSPNSKKLPDNAPQGGGTVLTFEAWKALPMKERNKRFQEMRQHDLTLNT